MLNGLNLVEVSQCSLCILDFSLVFHAISLKRSRFSKIATLICIALVAMKLLVSLISRLVACSARIVVDRQTDTQIKYYNPRCACAPRVNHDSDGTAVAPYTPLALINYLLQ